MYFNLPNGRTIEISFEQWLQLTDEDIEYLTACEHHGELIEDPFFNSAAFKDKQKFIKDDLPNLDSVSIEQMIEDLDAEIPPEE